MSIPTQTTNNQVRVCYICENYKRNELFPSKSIICKQCVEKGMVYYECCFKCEIKKCRVCHAEIQKQGYEGKRLENITNRK